MEEPKTKEKTNFMKQCDVRPASTIQGTTFNINFGQYIHILRNTDAVTSMIKKAHLKPTDTVLEVAPCTGNLTVKLLEQAKKVIVYEINSKLASTLEKRVQTNPNRPNLEIIRRNVLKQRLPTFDVCVAHIPYQISNAFVYKLVVYRPPFFKAAILLLQKGFVKQLVAKPGGKHYCFLTLTMRGFAKVKILGKVGKENFSPIPPVDYNIVKITQKKTVPDVPFYDWLNLTETAFKMKDRLMKVIFEDSEMMSVLLGSYKMRYGDYAVPEEFNTKVFEILKNSGYENKRAREMDVGDFVALLRAFLNENIHFY